MENCDPLLGCPLLRPRRPRRSGKQHTGSEFPPSHLITLSARAEPSHIRPQRQQYWIVIIRLGGP